MTRASERLIDVLVFAMLLVFGYMLRTEQPGLAGIIVAAGIGTWFQKNASAPHPTVEQAAALAAAEVLRVARKQTAAAEPEQVEIVGQVDVAAAADRSAA